MEYSDHPKFYNHTSADDEDLSDLCALKEKRLCFSIFYDIDMTTREGIHRTVKLSLKVVGYPLQLIKVPLCHFYSYNNRCLFLFAEEFEFICSLEDKSECDTT